MPDELNNLMPAWSFFALKRNKEEAAIFNIELASP